MENKEIKQQGKKAETSTAKRNPKVYYARSKDGNALERRDYNNYLQYAVKKMDMPGFDPEYKDIVDYILKITHRIWEERAVGVIYDTYHNEGRIHTCSTMSTGVPGVIMNTMNDQHAYPNRRIAPQSVIWSEDKPGEYFSSHRSVSTGTNTGDSIWGKATGRKIAFHSIADCYMKENRIYEEWLVRDSLCLVRSMGLDPHEVAKNLARKMETDSIQKNYGLNESMEGQFYPEKYTAADDSLGERLMEFHSQLFNYKMFDIVCDFFTDDALFYYVGDECLKGHDSIQGIFVSLLASFPGARQVVHRVTVNENEDGTSECAVRWVLQGLHEGYGMFGAPTGKPVEIMGISHYCFDTQKKVYEAYMYYDVIDVLKQTYLGDVDDDKLV